MSAEHGPHPAWRRRIERIQMRDGVMLNAVIYGALDHGARPAIFRLTPYLADTFYGDGPYFASRQYVYVCVDVRGRGDSEGGPYQQVIHDAHDGADCIAWIARQPWSDGRVVMYGSSYSGTNQWLVAVQRPPALRAIAPSGVSLVGFDYPAPGGALPVAMYQVMTLTAGRSLYVNATADVEAWNSLLAALWRRHGRLRELSELTGVAPPQFERLARGEAVDACFPGCSLEAAHYARIAVPVMSTTGTADLTCAGTLEAHRRFLAAAGDALRERSRLVVGPWDHIGLESGSDRVAGLALGPRARLDVRELKVDWFDWVLGRRDVPARLAAPVTWYLAGADEWRDGAGIDGLSSARRRFHVLAGAGEGDVLTPIGDTSFRCNPDDFTAVAIELQPREVPVPVKENAPGIRIGRVYHDLSTVLCGADPTCDAFVTRLGDGGVAWESAPLPHAIDVVGHPRLALPVAVDAPDADLALILCAVLPEAPFTLVLSSDFIRLRHRNGLDREDLITPDHPFVLERSRLSFVARRLPRGTRLRLVMRHGATLRKEKNLNSSTPVSHQRPEEARIASVKVHPGGRAGWLEVPVIDGAAE